MRILLFIFFIQLTFAAFCFDTPVPKDSRHVKDDSAYIGGQKISSKTYICDQSEKDVIRFYKKTMIDNGFAEVTEGARKDKPENLLRFRRDEDVVSVFAETTQEGTRIVLANFQQAKGDTGPTPDKVDWNDLMKSMPKEDMPGADLDIIPRPPNSVRQQSITKGAVAVLVYTTTLSSSDVADFYAKHMPDFGWKEAGAVDHENLPLSKTTGKVEQVQIGTMPPLGTFMKGSAQLQFTHANGTADITIMNIDPGKSGTVMVTVYYNEKKEVYEKSK